MLATSRRYWTLVKELQTGLLLTTGVAGYMCARCPFSTVLAVIGLAGSLFLAIAGSTVLNMWFDRDIDAKMSRTCRRPLPSGLIRPNKALVFGLVLAFVGVSLAIAIDRLFGIIVLAGLLFDVVIYTICLKRRTVWAIFWGGIAGGMPVLAGRALAIGHIDWIGLVLTMAILFWIPTHMLTYSMRYHDDYQKASIPTFPSRYGFQKTRHVIAISSVLAALAIAISAIGLGMAMGYIRVIALLSMGLLGLAIFSVVRPSEKINFSLFKYASFFMLNAMVLLIISGIY